MIDIQSMHVCVSFPWKSIFFLIIPSWILSWSYLIFLESKKSNQRNEYSNAEIGILRRAVFILFRILFEKRNGIFEFFVSNVGISAPLLAIFSILIYLYFNIRCRIAM